MSSVLPTPVGPQNMRAAIGRLGSFSPIRALLRAVDTAVTASSCPITRSCRCTLHCLTARHQKWTKRRDGCMEWLAEANLVIHVSIDINLRLSLFEMLPLS